MARFCITVIQWKKAFKINNLGPVFYIVFAVIIKSGPLYIYTQYSVQFILIIILQLLHLLQF